MKRILIFSSALLLLYSCKKEEKKDLDSMIHYRVYSTVSAQGDTLYAFYIPTAFTPNGDGLNDLYFAKGTDIDYNNFEMKIFYRTGNQIFYTTQFNNGWDGRANGGSDIAPVGNYNVLFKLKDNTGDSHEYTGTISLLK